MEKIIGISKQQGEYEGIKYCNYVLHCSYDPMDRGVGVCVHQYKVKESYMLAMAPDPYKLIGLGINNPYEDIFYDMNKRIKKIVFVKIQ